MPPAEAVEMRSTPSKGVVRDARPSIWFRNCAICPFPGTETEPVSPVDPPPVVSSSNVTVMSVLEGFATAIPV